MGDKFGGRNPIIEAGWGNDRQSKYRHRDHGPGRQDKILFSGALHLIATLPHLLGQPYNE